MLREENNMGSAAPELIIKDVHTTVKDRELIVFNFKNLVTSIIESEEKRIKCLNKKRKMEKVSTV